MKNRLSVLYSAVALGMIAFCCRPAQAQTYDLASNWLTSSNTSGGPSNGIWSYGYTLSLGSAFNLLDTYSTTHGLDYWGLSSNTQAGGIEHNPTSQPIMVGSQTWQPGTVSMHAGSTGQYSVARWTAPVSGSYIVSSRFYPGDTNGSTDVHVLKNSHSLFDGVYSGSNTLTYSGALSLASGDTIDFAVGYGSDGTYNYDDTGIAATISLITSDFNGDGKPDLLFQNSSTGQLAVWFMNGITPKDGAFVTPSQSSGWRAVGDADFNGDGKPDILFQNTSTNQLDLWTMNGVASSSSQTLSSTPPSGWNVVSIADFNGDGHPDLLLQNSSTGRLAIWYMNGATITDGTYVSPSPTSGWVAFGSGDFNGDGKPDILLQNSSTGQLAVWYMNNATATGGAYITPSQQAGWKCVSVIDLNGDGHPDLVFQNTSTGQLVYWLLNGVKATDGNYLSLQPQAGWQVVGPH